MPSGEEIQANLRAFVDRWRDYHGGEREEAQTFLNELFACYGGDRRELGARFEDFVSSAGFLDMHWPGVCIVEMKAPSRDLRVAQPQVERYWRESSKPDEGIPAARYVVLCSFQRFEVWLPGKYPTKAVAMFDLEDLPERYDALAFFAGPSVEPNFVEHYRELTKEAAGKVAQVFHSLADRSAAPPDELQRFILQAVWCMFAEDLGLLDGYPLQSTLNEVRSEPERSAPEIGFLFRVLNQKTNHNRKGRLAGTRYVNGELFAEPAEVGLNRVEIELMLEATAFDWRKVNPTIFGSLLEGVLGHDRRWELGAHYTHEVDIMKIVVPTIVRPWRERITATSTPTEARDLLDELCAFRVLDPACGCGNFLYVAYRELRSLEHEIKLRIQSLAEETGLPQPVGPWPYFPLANIQGLDIERSAVLIARVTLWMGHRQMIDLYGEAEPALPLQDLSGIKVADALRTPWPDTDCIIGNPPFLGSQHLRGTLGDDYVEWLKSQFQVGVKDYCTYWFRLAADHLEPGQRGGLVGTNSISQNRARSASLEYIVAQGGVITDAVATQKWPGDAKVHVSIVNWIRQPPQSVEVFVLDGVAVSGISTRLDPEAAGAHEPQALVANRNRCFQGPIPGSKDFVLDVETGLTLRHADTRNTLVVRPYLDSEDIANSPSQTGSRFTIDFGVMPLEETSAYPAPLEIVRNRARARCGHLESNWWRFLRPRPALRKASADLVRVIAVGRHGKRLCLAWCSPETMPTDATNVFTFDDDYSMGILLSKAHEAWAWAQSSTLKGDLRYTPSSVFMTFPWPDPVTDEQRERVAEASRRLLARRTEICVGEQLGLTKLYNAVDDGAWADLKGLHRELDRAVAACYGWSASVAQDSSELVRLLTERNREIVGDGRSYAPFDRK